MCQNNKNECDLFIESISHCKMGIASYQNIVCERMNTFKRPLAAFLPNKTFAGAFKLRSSLFESLN